MPTDKPKSERLYISTEEAADYLGVSIQTLYILIRNGTLKGYRPTRRILRLEKGEIEAYMQRSAK